MSDLTCQSCDYHREPAQPIAGYAECRRMPPSHAKIVGGGLALVYGLTSDDLPACGEYRSRDRLETKPGTPFETKGDVNVALGPPIQRRNRNGR